MPRTQVRGQRGSPVQARRKPSSTPRAARKARPRSPLLSPTQIFELAGVTLAGLGAIGLVSMMAGGAPVLAGAHQFLANAFGVGWPLPVVGTIALGGLLIWPQRVLPRTGDLVATISAAVAVLGLLSLARASAGGWIGDTVTNLLAGILGSFGAMVVLLMLLLLGSIVAFHFSPGAFLLGMVRAAQAAYAERQRLEGLVERAQRPARMAKAAMVVHALPKRNSTKAAPGSAWAEDPAPILPSDPEPEMDVEPQAAQARVETGEEEPVWGAPPEAEDRAPLRVVAEREDDDPWDDLEWKLPPTSLLDSARAKRERLEDEVKRNVRTIESTLQTFGVQARVIGVNSGPAVTQYELQPAAGVAVKRIVSLQNDLSLALAAAPLRIEAPIPGKSAVGIEVPNKAASLVSLREVVEAPTFTSGQSLAVALGHDVTGHPTIGDLARMPHLLIAGATGQGKSVCINALISSLLLRATPSELQLVMIDPKRVELNQYNDLPHLAVPVIVESHQAAAALRWAVVEMDRRYKLLSGEGVRNIKTYNERAAASRARPLPYVVIVIDELADLMMVAAGEIEELICRIAQLARAVGIHLVIATQRPSTDIITGLIKANVPSRIAFAVGSQVDSRVILDMAGAEKLLGRGDMLYQPIDAGKATRVQGALVTDREVDALVQFWKQQAAPRYREEILQAGATAGPQESGSERKLDPLFARAARATCAEGVASVSLIQRKFNVGYSRAGRIVDQLAEHRVVGAYQGSKSREVLMTLPDVDELLERLGIEG
jgi:DNA segregation ATPase FtsK/SpoIIIE, S-DNA-T family